MSIETEASLAALAASDALIAEYIEPSPVRPGVAEAWLKGRGISVWALIGDYFATPGVDAAERVADAFAIPIPAMLAAIEYYKRHKQAIDQRLADNEVPD